MEKSVPNYLKEKGRLPGDNSHDENLKWFRNAGFGLFIHYGLYSLLGKGEWVQYIDKIPLAEYEKLMTQFTACSFDADFIAELALEAGMKYVNLVAKHCDGFCLWNSKTTWFNSVNSPAGRDLVAEMREACSRKGLGFFVFYEHGLDWRHPHGPAPWDWPIKEVRPHYEPPDPNYAPREQYDFNKYIDYVNGHITELCTNYGTISGVWLDGAGVPHSGDKSKFRIKELYALIRSLQPHALISYKWGVEGDEDFYAPEETQIDRIPIEAIARDPASGDNNKPVEICTIMQKGFWGYQKDAEHLNTDEVMAKLRMAAKYNANLLLNIGPLGDGSVHPHDVKVLREVGKYIRTHGREIFYKEDKS
ncbi:MAG TPA: alpha-L-fucosidase precursor [Clostridiaceae bacterium]|nr:alpha-L-fucosidase precursor [Clostridiaceae bacterium]